MKVSKNRKLASILLMSITWAATSSTHADTHDSQSTVQPLEQTHKSGFPEKMKTFIELPGKRDVVEIPMQETFYIRNFVNELASDNNVGERLRESFIEISPTQLGVVTAKMKTNRRSLNMSIRDMDTGYYYEYDFGNGYLISTTLYIPINDNTDNEKLLISNKIDYLYKKFDSYLIGQGYTNTTSFLGKLFNSHATYEKEDILVDIDDYGILDHTFTLSATKKEIRDNISEIRHNVTKNDINLEFKNLDKVLDTK